MPDAKPPARTVQSDRAFREIVEQQRAARDANTATLKALRLAEEQRTAALAPALDAVAPKPRKRALKR